MKKAYLNWSSGKDAALALFKIQQSKVYNIDKLVTTVNQSFDRVSMHGLRTELLEEQAKALGLPLQTILLSKDVSMEIYSSKMKIAMEDLINKGYAYGVFGDVFLKDLRAYREDKLKEVGIKGVFPLWGKNTRILLEEFLAHGFKAITVCVNAKLLDSSFCGRIIDKEFIADLPDGVDPCGENGEFHTFVYDGPNFKKPVDFTIGEKVLRNYKSSKNDDDCYKKNEVSWDTSFWYCDLLLK